MISELCWHYKGVEHRGVGIRVNAERGEKGTGTPEFDTAVKASVLWNCGVSVSVRMDKIKSK